MEQPAPAVRVLVVDDSVVMRRVVARALERDPGIARTDFAGNGRLALEKILNRRPDVVVLDLEMPVLNGFETLKELRRTHPGLPVVLFSSVDERSARATLDALSLGATDFVLKPSGSAAVADAEAYVSQHLTPLVKALAEDRPRPVTARPSPSSAGPGAVDAVVLGVSTGGPDALSTLVRGLPAGLAVPLLVVQHMPPMFTRLLAERLDRVSALPVREAEDGEVVQPGTVYVAPGDRHLEVVRHGAEVRAALGDGPPENSCRPAADVLFRSAAAAYGRGVLGVVLTGMGRDGTRGCEAIRAAGGTVVVQDPETAVVGSMPASVLEAGLAHASVGIADLAAHLVQRVTDGAR